jgi:hypothetical protein
VVAGEPWTAIAAAGPVETGVVAAEPAAVLDELEELVALTAGFDDDAPSTDVDGLQPTRK